MANLGEYLNATFLNTGLDNENPALKELVTKAANIEMSDELINKFNSSYFTIEAAKNNSTITNHIKAQIYNGEDRYHKELMLKNGFDDSMQAEFLNEKSTTKRRDLIIDKIGELREKKAGASQGEGTKLTKQIEELNSELAKLKTTTVSKESYNDLDNSYKQKLNNLYMGSLLSGYTYGSDLAKEEDYLLPKSKINKELSEKKLRVVFENDKPKLEQEDGTDYFENNVKIDFKTFTDKTLAKNNLLAASKPATHSTTPTIASTQKVGGLDNSKFMAAVDNLQATQRV